jgi:predicted membrane protein
MPVEVRYRVFSDAGSIPAISTGFSSGNDFHLITFSGRNNTMALRYWLGSVLVLLGIALFADQLYPAWEVGQWVGKLWPLTIILLGAVLLVARSTTWLGGMFILVLGCLLQIAALGILHANVWGLLGPALLILVGVLIVFRIGKPGLAGAAGQEVINHFVIFSGLETRPQSAIFRGGTVTAMFSGVNVDLRDSTLAEEGAYLELTAAFGGINIIVPKEWRLDLNGIPLFGAWSNKSMPAASNEGPLLTVRCLAMFGGIEIKN